MVSRGASLDQRDSAGNTALHVAAGAGHAAVIRYLVLHGSNRTRHTVVVVVERAGGAKKGGKHPRSIASPLNPSPWALCLSPLPGNARNNGDETPLDIALRRNQEGACAALRGEPAQDLLDDDMLDDGGGGDAGGSQEKHAQSGSGDAPTDVYEPRTPAELQEVALVRIEQYERGLKQAKEQFKGAGGVLQEEIEAAKAKAEQDRWVVVGGWGGGARQMPLIQTSPCWPPQRRCRKEQETAEHIEKLNETLNLERLRREELEGLLSQARDRILELLAEVGWL